MRGHLFCRDTVHLVALDKATGHVAWDMPYRFPYEHQVFLSHAQGQVVVVGSENIDRAVVYDLFAFDADTGELSWHTQTPTKTHQGGVHGEQWQHPRTQLRVYVQLSAANLSGLHPCASG